MPSGPLLAFSGLMTMLNRGLAWIDFAVHYASGYFFYWVLRGMKPQTHTRPRKLPDGRSYSPSVVITGASQGIGLSTALSLADKGYNVFATVKDEGEVRRAKEAVNDAFADKPTRLGAVHITVMDVLSKESINQCVNYIETVLEDSPNKPLLAVVNNAGFCMIAPFELTPDEDIKRAFDLDLFAYFAVIRAFLPILKRNKGRIINVGSFGGYANVPMWAVYCALKAAIENFGRVLRLEMMPFGVGVTTIRPGFTRTWGIGPKITHSWAKYYDNIPQAAGVDSLGNTIMACKPPGEAEEKIYRPIMDKWHKFTMAGVEGLAQPSEAVAETVHDALTDKFLQPYYTIGYDANLGQMARDLAPESWWEYGVAKSYGCL